MHEKFLAVSVEKQRVIIGTALSEFAKQGYHKANTNVISEKAGISKGLLFHYFGSKKSLYLYILDDTIRTVSAEVYRYCGSGSTDLFEMLRVIAVAKLRVAVERPEEYRLIYDAFMQTPDELKAEMENRFSGIMDMNEDVILSSIDDSPFRPEVGKACAVRILMAYSRGIYENYYDKFRTVSADEALAQFDDLERQFNEDMLLLKKVFYKDISE
jgi:AcrR family transcriptional regulator